MKTSLVLSAPPLTDRLVAVVGDSRVADAQKIDGCTLVSVVMPVRNGMPWIEQQLRALTSQEVAVDWEVVVADNGSDDGTASCLERWRQKYPLIRVVDASAGRGAGAARNIGVRAARGHLLAFCDADDVVQPGWISSMTSTLASADLVAGVFDFGALDGVPQSVPVPAATKQLGFLPFALSANLAVRREAFDAVHGFCEELWPGEDVDLCWRLQLAGYRFTVTSHAIVNKRDRNGVRPMLRAAWAYGGCGPRLYKRYRADGMRRDLKGAVKAWIWLVATGPGLVNPSRHRQWVRTFGIRVGRLAGSVHNRVFFP
jgi:glycosyltransferase involved in cell wall biosynthesis